MGEKSPMVPELFRVDRIRKETYDTVTLEMKPANGNRLPTFSPGQFNMLYVFGVGEVPISISGDPHAGPSRLAHTARAVGTVTERICSLRSGDLLGVRGPFGSHWPIEEARGKDVLIVAGGIGWAPLRPAILQLIANRGRYGRIAILYGSRTPSDILYARELERWRGRFDLDVQITVDSAADDWYGHVGVVTTLIPRAEYDPYHTVAMVCGPEIMMRFTVQELAKRNLGPESIFVSMERNMKCGVGFCGHCQYGPAFICKDGPVFRLDRIQSIFGKREI